MASADSTLQIEVVTATPERQTLVELTVPAGTTAGDAIRLSGLAAQFPEVDLVNREIAIWGKTVAPATLLEAGDRVEVLRPLAKDPREARREIASQGGFMGHSAHRADE